MIHVPSAEKCDNVGGHTGLSKRVRAQYRTLGLPQVAVDQGGQRREPVTCAIDNRRDWSVDRLARGRLGQVDDPRCRHKARRSCDAILCVAVIDGLVVWYRRLAAQRARERLGVTDPHVGATHTTSDVDGNL